MYAICSTKSLECYKPRLNLSFYTHFLYGNWKKHAFSHLLFLSQAWLHKSREVLTVHLPNAATVPNRSFIAHSTMHSLLHYVLAADMASCFAPKLVVRFAVAKLNVARAILTTLAERYWPFVIHYENGWHSAASAKESRVSLHTWFGLLLACFIKHVCIIKQFMDCKRVNASAPISPISISPRPWRDQPASH